MNPETAFALGLALGTTAGAFLVGALMLLTTASRPVPPVTRSIDRTGYATTAQRARLQR